jgi:aminotransferase
MSMDAKMIRDTSKKIRPDIRVLTRLVPPRGNLVQGQSELAIHPDLANAAAEVINASQNHYSPAEGVSELREAVAQKISLLNGIKVDPKATPHELLITPGATGGLITIAQTYLKNSSAIVFEPYYPYHRRIVEELGGHTEVLQLHGENLDLDGDELRVRCRALTSRQPYPLRAIIACTPVNPTGKVFTSQELEIVRDVCREFDLLCIADEVYEHYVEDVNRHVSIATLGGMRERTITVNSFSKSWNISGWRLGYVYGDSRLIAPLNNANNVFYVCSPTPLQRALAKTLMADPQYYSNLRERFVRKRIEATEVLKQLGFEIYDSGSTFYIWARIPRGYTNAMEFNEMLMSRAGVAGVPGSAFADSDEFDDYMRFCIAREDDVLESALGKIRKAISS